jgi:hypothetical protein
MNCLVGQFFCNIVDLRRAMKRHISQFFLNLIFARGFPNFGLRIERVINSLKCYANERAYLSPNTHVGIGGSTAQSAHGARGAN